MTQLAVSCIVATMDGSSNHDHLVWEEISSRSLLDTRIFQVRLSRRRAQDGAEHDYVLVDSLDWCHVIAPFAREDGTECFVMARQYRQGGHALTLEFPGGLVDEGEAPEAAAMRELEEETGFTASALTLIGRTNPNPAFMTNVVYTYLATGVRLAAGQRLDEMERLDVALVPVQEITELLRPEFHEHAIMLNALQWYTHYLRDGLDYESRVAAWGAST